MKRQIEKAERAAFFFAIPTLSFSVGLMLAVIWGTLK